MIGILDALPGYLRSRGFVAECAIEGEQAIAVKDDEIMEAIEMDSDHVVELIRQGEVKEMQAVASILLWVTNRTKG